MLVGHYSASFTGAKLNSKVPLWILMAAAQFPDFLWAILVLLKVEKMSIDAALPPPHLKLIYMPYSHSLAGAVVLTVIILLLGKRQKPWRPLVGTSSLIAAVVFSHWLLDLVVHQPDLPLYDDTDKVGLGLWDYPVIALIVEILLLLATMAWYGRNQTQKTNVSGSRLGVLGAFFLIVQTGVVIVPLPQWVTPAIVACLLLVFYIAVTLVVFQLERSRAGYAVRR